MTMNLIRTSLVLALLTAGTAVAQPANSSRTGALPVPANRIAGYWHVEVTAGPCGGTMNTFLGLNTFHAGGTLSDTNTFAPASRGPGMGVWEYLGRGPQGVYLYKNHFQFARFLPDGSFDGLQDIYNDITLQPDGMSWTGITHAFALNPDGSVRAEICGTGLANRIPID